MSQNELLNLVEENPGLVLLRYVRQEGVNYNPIVKSWG